MKKFQIFRKVAIFGKFADFWKIFRFLEDNPITCDILDTDYNSDN